MIKEINNVYTAVLRLNIYGESVRRVLDSDIYDDINIKFEYTSDGFLKWRIIHSDKQFILNNIRKILSITIKALSDEDLTHSNQIAWMLGRVTELFTDVNESLFTNDINSNSNSGGCIFIERGYKLDMLHDELNDYLPLLEDNSIYSDKYHDFSELLKKEYGLNIVLSSKNSMRYAKTFFDMKYGLDTVFKDSKSPTIRKLTGSLDLHYDDILDSFRKAGCKYVYHIGSDYLLHIYGDMNEAIKIYGSR